MEIFLCFWVGGILNFYVLYKLYGVWSKELEWTDQCNSVYGIFFVDGNSSDIGNKCYWLLIFSHLCASSLFFSEDRLKNMIAVLEKFIRKESFTFFLKLFSFFYIHVLVIIINVWKSKQCLSWRSNIWQSLELIDENKTQLQQFFF